MPTLSNDALEPCRLPKIRRDLVRFFQDHQERRSLAEYPGQRTKSVALRIFDEARYRDAIARRGGLLLLLG